MKGEIRLRGRRWAIGPSRFANPARVVTATEPSRVRQALEEVEDLAAAGHWLVGFVSYQAASGLNPRLEVPGQPALPLIWFGAYTHRHADDSLSSRAHQLRDWAPAMSREEHAVRVGAIRQLIAAGETYQVNLTFPITARLIGDPGGLFEGMVGSQPDSYAALIDLGRTQVLSVSPESYLTKRGRTVTTRPMKGTAQRGRYPEEDRVRAKQLVESEKERAGNVMVVDLLRNDLSRVAQTGTVRASDLFRAERHPTVWQLTSTVEAELRTGIRLADLFEATFPSGSVTGAPKESTMRIIAQQETFARDAYCGAVGYIAPGGEDAEFSVAIRTGSVTGDRFIYHVGGGITYDSEASLEYDECIWKARVIATPDPAFDLLETMRFEPGIGVRLLDGHLARLQSSARFWDIPYAEPQIRKALEEIESDEPAKVRLIVTRGGQVEVDVEPIPEVIEPVQLVISDRRVDPSDPLFFHKTTDRSRYPNTAKGVEAVMLNRDGLVTETNISNIVARFEDRWVTPPIDAGCLPGVYRSELITSGKLEEEAMTLDDLVRADELGVINSLRGWRRATMMSRRDGSVGSSRDQMSGLPGMDDSLETRTSG